MKLSENCNCDAAERDAAQVMVGEGVASLAAIPEPRVRAFPSRGSSGYGPLS
jgi:hypothetical protein